LKRRRRNMAMRHGATTAVMLAVLFTGYAVFYAITTPAQQMGGMFNRNPTPPVRGLYKGQGVVFIHTEASDPQVAATLTRMMGAKVFTVPSLAKVPKDLLASVYVFTNGIKGEGPFGFQLDVFDSVPGQRGYTPLRAVTLVTWKQGITPRLLGSVEEILAAARKGQVSLRRLGTVVNMPIVSWPGGQR
jgi:hypothetical protein